jgi:hypothetical protein
VQHIKHSGRLIVDDGQRELLNRIDATITDDRYEGQALIEKVFGGLQGVVASVFDHLDDPLSFARLALHNEHNVNSALRIGWRRMRCGAVATWQHWKSIP